jgi:hypothetical protein
MLVDCRECQATVDASVEGRYTVKDDLFGEISDEYNLLRCPRCDKPFLVQHGNDYTSQEVLFPQPDLRISSTLPQLIRTSHLESQACFRAKAYTATAIMCRKTLEGLCAEHGVTGKNLVHALSELKEKNIIEQRLYEWADALRIYGNEAAHDVTVTVSAEDARDILEFTNALLEYVFTFREKFEAFKARQAQRRGA